VNRNGFLLGKKGYQKSILDSGKCHISAKKFYVVELMSQKVRVRSRCAVTNLTH